MNQYFYMLLTVMISLSSVLSAQEKTPQEQINAKVAQVRESINHITPADLNTRLGNDTSFVLIDVREADEYAAGHLNGAVHIARGVMEWGVCRLVKDPGQEIIVYCRSGGRSALAVQSLTEIGFTNVKDLQGGVKAWANASQPFYNQHGEILITGFGKKEIELCD